MQQAHWRHKTGATKIQQCCQQALRDGLQWAWVDTCAIDKTSSAELTEAINSMFSWYRNAAICYAYLADVDGIDCQDDTGDVAFDPVVIARSRWFTRGWTLQELIAPAEMLFFSANWTTVGRKDELGKLLSAITGVDELTLKTGDFSEASVARRMSWASERQTTRVEDIAYCLLGIFGVNMPLLYGEGEKAFMRLQEEIMKHSDDESVFAWSAAIEAPERRGASRFGGLLARHPAQFALYGEIVPLPRPKSNGPFTMTNKGLRIQLPLIQLADGDPHDYIALLSCQVKNNFSGPVAIPLRRRVMWEDQFLRRADTTPFIFKPSQAARFTSQKAEHKIIYVKDGAHAFGEPVRKAYFQIRSVPAGFRITQAYPDWSWNEDIHVIAAEYQGKRIKAAFQLERQSGGPRLQVVIVVDSATIRSSTLANSSFFHIYCNYMPLRAETPLKDLFDRYPEPKSWYATEGVGKATLLGGMLATKVSVKEEAVVGLRVYPVNIEIEANAGLVKDLPKSSIWSRVSRFWQANSMSEYQEIELSQNNDVVDGD